MGNHPLPLEGGMFLCTRRSLLQEYVLTTCIHCYISVGPVGEGVREGHRKAASGIYRWTMRICFLPFEPMYCFSSNL